MGDTFRNVMIVVMIVSLIISAAGMVFAGDVKVNLKIPNVYCATKGALAVYAAMSIPGVSSAVDDWTRKLLTVVFDDTKTNIETIKKALSEEDFPATGEELLSK